MKYIIDHSIYTHYHPNTVVYLVTGNAYGFTADEPKYEMRAGGSVDGAPIQEVVSFKLYQELGKRNWLQSCRYTWFMDLVK